MASKVICDVCGKNSSLLKAGDPCTKESCEGKYIEPEDQLLPVEYEIRLNEEQLKEIAEKMVELDGEEDALKMEQKKVSNEWKSKIEGVVTHRKSLSRQYKNRKRVETAMCYPEYRYAEGVTLMLEAGTGREISRREMTKEERQLSIMDM